MASLADKKVNMELPYDREGKVDWDTLGKIATAQLLGEVVCASYVDKRHSFMQERDRQIDTDWEYSHEKKEITVLRKKMADSSTGFMGRGVIDEPMDVVAALYKDVENFYIWDKFLVEGVNLKVLSESPTYTDYIGYQRFETSQYCGAFHVKRDMLYYCRCNYTDGKYVQACASIEDPDFPPIPEVTRMKLNIASGFVLEPYCGNPSKTLVSYLVNIDMKNLPKFVTNQVLKRHALSIHYVREYFKSPILQQKLKARNESSLLSYAQDVSMSWRHFEDPLAISHYVADGNSKSHKPRLLVRGYDSDSDSEGEK